MHRLIVKIKSNSGIGLIEVMAGMALSVIVVTSLVSLSVYTLRTSSESQISSRATKYVNTQMELIRAYRDSVSWSIFIANVDICDCHDVYNPENPYTCPLNYPTEVCNITIQESPTLQLIKSTGAKTYSIASGGTSQISVFFTAQTVSANIRRVRVFATYSLGGQNRAVSAYTDFSNWQNN